MLVAAFIPNPLVRSSRRSHGPRPVCHCRLRCRTAMKRKRNKGKTGAIEPALLRDWTLSNDVANVPGRLPSDSTARLSLPGRRPLSLSPSRPSHCLLAHPLVGSSSPVPRSTTLVLRHPPPARSEGRAAGRAWPRCWRSALGRNGTGRLVCLGKDGTASTKMGGGRAGGVRASCVWDCGWSGSHWLCGAEGGAGRKCLFSLRGCRGGGVGGQ